MLLALGWDKKLTGLKKDLVRHFSHYFHFLCRGFGSLFWLAVDVILQLSPWNEGYNLLLLKRIITEGHSVKGSNTVSKKWKQIVQAAMLMRWTCRHHSQLVGSPAGLVMRSLISRLCEKTKKQKTLLSFSFQSSWSDFNADRACPLALWLPATHYFSGHACLHTWCLIVAGWVFWMWLLTHASRQKIYIFWHWPITLSFKGMQ